MKIKNLIEKGDGDYYIVVDGFGLIPVTMKPIMDSSYDLVDESSAEMRSIGQRAEEHFFLGMQRWRKSKQESVVEQS